VGTPVGGGPETVKVAVAVPPVPPSVELTVPVVLVLAPELVPVTVKENVQEALAAKVAPERDTLPEPATAVIVPLGQEPVSPFGDAKTTPEGSVLLKATPVREKAFGLLTV
jgi:hypothetical protein